MPLKRDRYLELYGKPGGSIRYTLVRRVVQFVPVVLNFIVAFNIGLVAVF